MPGARKLTSAAAVAGFHNIRVEFRVASFGADGDGAGPVGPVAGAAPGRPKALPEVSPDPLPF